MADIKLIQHGPGAPGLRLLGLGPNFIPRQGLKKLRLLLERNAFWAQGRKTWQLRQMLLRSEVVVSAWQGARLVGFGRATSDGVYRAVLWDVVVPQDLQRLGIGRKIVEAIINSDPIRKSERVYVMTTNSHKFYKLLKFKDVTNQKLMIQDQS